MSPPHQPHHNHREPLIPKHGGFRQLKSFQIAQLVYDVTVRFCNKYIDRRSRTHDQMVQAARSGVQNIAEGSVGSGTSKKFELKLTQVARASLEELKLDYEDFLRHRELKLWHPTDPRRKQLVARRCTTADEVATWVTEITRQELNGQNDSETSITSIKSIPSIKPKSKSTLYPEISANAALVLIGVACTLLDRQVSRLAQNFTTDGGFTERLYHTRQSQRNSR